MPTMTRDRSLLEKYLRFAGRLGMKYIVICPWMNKLRESRWEFEVQKRNLARNKL